MYEHSPIRLSHDAERFRFIKKIYLQRERELAAARRISEALSQRMKVEDLIEQALRTILEVLDAENGSLLLADVDKKQRLVEQMRHHELAVALHTSLQDVQLPENQAILLFQGLGNY